MKRLLLAALAFALAFYASTLAQAAGQTWRDLRASIDLHAHVVKVLEK